MFSAQFCTDHLSARIVTFFCFLKKKTLKKSVKMSWEENIASLKDQGLEHVAFYGIGSGWVVPSDGSNVSNIYYKIIIM